MKVFIDFDDVIFNTKQFKHDFKNMFVENGISEDVFEKYYNDPLDPRAIKTFDPWRQIALINMELGIDVAHLTKLVNEYIADMSAYVFADIADFAEFIGSENIHVISFGELEFQTKKVENSGIGKYIANIKITQDSKAEEIQKILISEDVDTFERIFFIDDRIEQIREVKEKLPQIISILLKRPEGRYQEMKKEKCCDYEAHNLRQVQEIISKL